MKRQTKPVLYNIQFLIFTLSWMLTSCFPESETEKQHAESDLKIANYIKENNIEVEISEHGIHYQSLVSNANGKTANIGDVLNVKYEIRTLSGKLLESHVTDSTFLKFDNYAVIPSGFNYGIDVMKKGEKIRCFIPSYLAFNTYSLQDEFGPNTNFIIDIELIDISSEDDILKSHIDAIENYIQKEDYGDITPTTSGLYFISLEEGNGKEAKINHTATLHYKRKYLNNSLIQETEANKPLVVHLSSNQLVKGFKEGVLKMEEGQKALLIMPSEIAFGSSVKVLPSTIRKELWEDGYIGSLVDAYEVVQYEVELLELK